MATSTQISVEEYLRTVYQPDCDYTDGLVEERNLGETEHSAVQSNLIFALRTQSRANGLTIMPEWRFQVAPTRFRVPDVVVVRGRPEKPILTQIPLLCIEILSPEDRLPRVNARMREYLDFGVPAVWLIDPEAQSVTVYRKNSIEPVTGPTVRVEGTEVDIPLEEIFE